MGLGILLGYFSPRGGDDIVNDIADALPKDPWNYELWVDLDTFARLCADAWGEESDMRGRPPTRFLGVQIYIDPNMVGFEYKKNG